MDVSFQFFLGQKASQYSFTIASSLSLSLSILSPSALSDQSACLKVLCGAYFCLQVCVKLIGHASDLCTLLTLAAPGNYGRGRNND